MTFRIAAPFESGRPTRLNFKRLTFSRQRNALPSEPLRKVIKAPMCSSQRKAATTKRFRERFEKFIRYEDCALRKHREAEPFVPVFIPQNPHARTSGKLLESQYIPRAGIRQRRDLTAPARDGRPSVLPASSRSRTGRRGPAGKRAS